MASKKPLPTNNDDADFLDGEAGSVAENPGGDESDELEGLEKEFDSVLGAGTDEDAPHCARSPDAVDRRLATKRRLDAHLERKWFKEHGWDDDDDLFDDEFFQDELTHPSHHR